MNLFWNVMFLWATWSCLYLFFSNISSYWNLVCISSWNWFTNQHVTAEVWEWDSWQRMHVVHLSPSASFHWRQTTSTRGILGALTPSCSTCRASCAPTLKHGFDKKVSGLKNMWVRTKDNSKRIPGNEKPVGSCISYLLFDPMQSTLKRRHIIYSPSLFFCSLPSFFFSFWTLINVRTWGWMETVLQGHATHRYPSKDFSTW